MALDPSPPSAAPAAIENELLSYRAVSPAAITSLILGVLSLLCFADLWFLVLAVGAVVLGSLADRKIQRMSDVLTGQSLARTGVVLGLVFGLSSVTIATVQGMIRKSEAQKFAENFAEKLEHGSVSECVWYRLDPARRKEIEPGKALDELKGQRSEAGPPPGELEESPIEQIKTRLATDPEKHHIHFDAVERHGSDRLEPYAIVRLEVEGPATENHTEVEYALLILKAANVDGKRQWWIDQMNYPYRPDTAVLPAKKSDDDGHGHAH